YGPIAADQNWDFTQQSLTTRADGIGAWSENYALETVFDEHEAITKIFENLPENGQNRGKVKPFVFVVPDDNIVITPQFQGKDSWLTELHMVVNDGRTSQDYTVWTKAGKSSDFQTMQRKFDVNSAWEQLPPTAGTTQWSTTYEEGWDKPVYAVQSKQLVIAKGTLPVGATITLYTKVFKNNDSREYYYYSTDVAHTTETIDGKTVQVYGKSIGYVTAENQADKVTYVACEGGNNTDLNDLIFKMEGITPIPLEEPFEFKEIIAKRYMVEDLGATASSDIDFNDIVVDFENSHINDFVIKYDGKEALIEKTGERDYELATTIRALGGTLDMELYTVNGAQENMLFKKSASATVGNWTWNNLSELDYKTMYNTGWSGDPFSYNPKNSASKDSWIGKATKTSDSPINDWEPANNNIMIKVYHTGTTTGVGENDHTGHTTPYIIRFPKNGEVPCMVAFRPVKQWRLERDGISKENGVYWFKNTSSKFPGEYYTE
ncbi:MAG: hypothetical protein HUJ98_09105, partial [Bacteroidaceae bacterium]|nr:hypothetical protein [Bacteroidaceae bacterium]MCF0186626.1 hypothetical protein [Bacteroidaceae bacterium]